MSPKPVLIAYDGSENADHAIEVAADLMGGGPAKVIHAWEPVSSAAGRAAVYAVVYDTSGEMLGREAERANEVAEQGVERARAAGFEATGSACRGGGPLWQTIVDQAELLDPRVIVLGTRGLTGIRSTILGSVSQAVASHGHLPTLIVPLAAAGKSDG